jgi:hypothetical protein
MNGGLPYLLAMLGCLAVGVLGFSLASAALR